MKKKDKKGNDEFDYSEATPDDPDDDCNMPMKYPSTMHSFQKKNPSDGKVQYETLKSNHDSFCEDLGYNKSTFQNLLKNRAFEDFRVRYSGY